MSHEGLCQNQVRTRKLAARGIKDIVKNWNQKTVILKKKYYKEEKLLKAKKGSFKKKDLHVFLKNQSPLVREVIVALSNGSAPEKDENVCRSVLYLSYAIGSEEICQRF